MKKALHTSMLLTATLMILTSCAMQQRQPAMADGWYATCNTGHGKWNGPKRNTRQEAEMDATAHDQANHDGTQTAIFQHISQ